MKAYWMREITHLSSETGEFLRGNPEIRGVLLTKVADVPKRKHGNIPF
jgi:hypothetical protein